jgi:hypothetical protein
MSLSILHVGPQGLDSAVAPDGFLIAQRRLERAVHRAAQAEGVTLRFDAMGSPGLDENTPAEKRALVWGGVQRLVIEDMAPEIARNQARRTGTDLRADALNTAAGLIGREMLVQTMPVIEEPLPVFEFSEVAEVDSTLPLGADSYRLEYQRLTGEAQVMRSGGTAPLVDASRDRVDRPHHILWSRSTVDFRERANGEFAGLNVAQIKQAAHEPAHLSAVDGLFWNGNDTLGHWGVFNYPALPEYSTGLSLASLTAAQLLTAIENSVARVEVASERRFNPTILRMSVVLYGYCRSLRLTDGTSVLKALTDDGFTVVKCRKLDAWNGVAGSYAMLCDGSEPGARMKCFFRPPILVPGLVHDVMAEMYAISGYGGMFLPHPVGAEVTLFT